ncbi:MarR family transcriptional regulator [Microbacterium panaciterrae]|uniref:MarR family transcriptional regulator n=1 Tax=Microbacterium panaciterrae TaxID=985759 RepID=A0ABP8PR94_9MICO
MCFTLYSTVNATLGLYRELLAPWGLSFQQAMTLAAVWELEPASPSDLAERLKLDSSSVTGLLNRMEAADLVCREMDPGDRRRVLVRATQYSKELQSELVWVEQCIAEALSMNSAESDALVASLNSLRQRVSTYTASPFNNTSDKDPDDS